MKWKIEGIKRSNKGTFSFQLSLKKTIFDHLIFKDVLGLLTTVNQTNEVKQLS